MKSGGNDVAMERDDELITASSHVGVLRRRWRLIAVATVLGGLAGFVLSMTQATAYAAEAKVLVPAPAAADPGTAVDPDQVATEAEFVLSDTLVAEVASSLQSPLSPNELITAVSVEASTGTSVLVISARQPTADAAAALANAFAEGYVRFRANQSAAARQFMKTQVNALEQRITAIREGLVDLDASARAVALGTLTDLSARQSDLEDRLLVAQTANAAESGGRVLNAATPPGAPAQPRPVFNVGLGVAFGLILGLVAAYLRDGGVSERRT